MNKKTIFGASLGTLLEWYDYTIYGFLSVPFSKLFFPDLKGTTAILYTYAIFAIGYLARPIGGFILGFLGDKYGRKWILILSASLMGVCTVLMGLLPTYATFGTLSAFFLLGLRILQGLTVGGEYMSAAVFLVEHAPSRARGFFGSMNNVGGGIGCLLGSLFVTLLSFTMDEKSFLAWGWRLPFFFGTLTAALGVYVRLQLSETSVYLKLQQKKLLEQNPVGHAFRTQTKRMFLSFALVLAQSVSFYLSTLFFLTWSVEEVHVPYSLSLVSTTCALAVLVLVTLMSGFLSDRFGRKKLLGVALLSFVFFAIPLFAWMDHSPTLSKMILGQSLLAAFAALYNGTLPATLVESFFAKSRCTALTISYNISAGIFGGSTLLVATYLIKLTKSALAPAYLLAGVCLFSFIFVVFLTESFHLPLKYIGDGDSH